MEYTELADYPSHGGRITGWVPTSKRFGWRVDPRALAVNHEWHVRDAIADPQSHVGSWIGTAFRIPGHLDPEVFARAVRDWIARHEAFRTTAVADRDGERPTRRTIAASSIGLSRKVVAPSQSADQVGTRIEGFFAEAVSAVRWPHVAVVTVEPIDDPEADWFTVVFAADHAVMDAYSQIIAIAEITELYVARLTGRDNALPECGSYADFSALERAMADVLEPLHPAVAKWRDYLFTRGDGHLPRFPLPVTGIDNGTEEAPSAHQASESTWLLDAEQAEQFAAVSKAAGGSQTAGVMAAVKIAFARLGAVDGIRYLMPMHTRVSAEFAAAAGWFVGVMPVDDGLGTATRFTEAMEQTRSSLKENRDLVPFALPAVTTLLDVDPVPGFVISFVDARAVYGADGWTEHERALRSRVQDGSEVYLWINRAKGGINLSLRRPNNAVARYSLEAFVNEFRAVLNEVAIFGDAGIGRRASGVDEVGAE